MISMGTHANAAEVKQLADETSASIYLKCSAKADPEGLNDVFIDTKNRTFTDSFGTVKTYKEDGQLLVADTYIEVNSERMLSTAWRINRYTLEFTSLSPVLKLYRTGTCVKLDRKFGFMVSSGLFKY